MGVAAFASWAGFPGPGEPVLIAAAVFASKHKLDITPLVFWAWMGANAGGIVGWLIGMKAGRSVITAPGPLRGFRIRAVERGEALFKRFMVPAILFTPTWVAGINRAPARYYLPTNAVSSLALWALPIAVASYYAAGPLLDLVNDLGAVALIVLIVLVVVAVGGELLRRRRRGDRSGPSRAEGSISD